MGYDPYASFLKQKANDAREKKLQVKAIVSTFRNEEEEIERYAKKMKDGSPKIDKTGG